MKKKSILTTIALLASVCSAMAAEDNTVEVKYNGENVVVEIADNISEYVTVSIDNATVSVKQADTAGADTSGEILYILSGNSDNGSFYLEGSYKATVTLSGLSLTCTTGPAINIQNGKRINVSIKNGTENTLTDAAGGDWKGCFVCKGHTEFKGKGTLTVNGNTAHGIWSKEYVEIKNCTINIPGAVKDGINCNQYFMMESGTLSITNPGDDGIQVSYKDEPPTEAEDTGNFTQADGTISITGHGSEGVCIKADGIITFKGGTQDFNTSDIMENASTTGISSARTENSTAEGIYDLSGRRLPDNAQPQKGIYIIKRTNGTQKVLK